MNGPPQAEFFLSQKFGKYFCRKPLAPFFRPTHRIFFGEMCFWRKCSPPLIRGGGGVPTMSSHGSMSTTCPGVAVSRCQQHALILEYPWKHVNNLQRGGIFRDGTPALTLPNKYVFAGPSTMGSHCLCNCSFLSV